MAITPLLKVPFTSYADVSALTHDSVAFAGRLLAETGVAITPGVDFDACHGKTHVRLSYAGSTQDIKKAVQRINSWVTKNLADFVIPKNISSCVTTIHDVGIWPHHYQF